MTSVVVGVVGGAGIASALWLALRSTFAGPVFARSNYRGVMVPVGPGIILAITALTFAGLQRGLLGLDVRPSWLRAGDLTVLAALGFGLLGLIDDLAGDGPEKGFSGHLGAMKRGDLTTGGLKMLCGGVVAVVVAGTYDAGHPSRFVVDALLIALLANLANLFDRAPGRAAKVGIAGGLALLVTHASDPPHGVAVVVGAVAGLVVFDLREELMLGDAGANVIGGVLGTGVMLSCSFPVRVGVLVVALLLNVLSEKVSFTKVIDRTPPLRCLDRLGRRD